jgi:hypothetical protein
LSCKPFTRWFPVFIPQNSQFCANFTILALDIAAITC